MGETVRWFIEEFHDDEVGLIIKTNIAKNSVSSKINKPAALQKTRTKKRTECIGFLELMTIVPETTAILEKI